MSTDQAPASSSLARRTATGVLFVPTLVGAAILGGWVFAGLIAVLAAIGTWEYAHLVRRAGVALPTPSLVGTSFLVPLALHRFGADCVSPILAIATVLLVMNGLYRRADASLARVAYGLFGIVYVSLLLGHLVLMRAEPLGAAGADAVLTVFLMTWACDTGAYAVGRAIGRHRPWPMVSPNKSLEGAAGGLIASVLAAVLAHAIFGLPTSRSTIVLLGAILGIVCQVGDLVESLFKRQAGIKDTSRLIPGHGGMLDRFDGMLLTAPTAYYLFRIVVDRAP